MPRPPPRPCGRVTSQCSSGPTPKPPSSRVPSQARSVPAVIGGSGSVFATPAASDWRGLLDALERPTSRDRAATAALTSFVGWDAARVATASDEEWEDLHWSLHRWAALLRRRGVAALLESLTVSRQLPERVLSRPSGERFLTDLRHVGQLLHAAAVAEGLGSKALGAWLAHRIAEAADDVNNEDRSRRLESDAEAVQVLTVHRSKGLEFPIVYCPFMWSSYSPKDPVPVFHDAANGHLLTIDVGVVDDGSNRLTQSQSQAQLEQRGEDLRLLYVALTRAEHQAVVWWAGSRDSKDSPLGRLLFAGGENGVVAPVGHAVLSDEQVAEQVASLGGGISVERIGPVADGAWNASLPPAPELEADSFDRTLDHAWRRASYSSIAQASHEQAVTSEPEQDSLSDEDVTGAVAAEAPSSPSDAAWQGLPLLLSEMAGGTRVGTLIHSVLEKVDFAATDLESELRAALNSELSWQHLDLGDPATVIAGLRTAIESPLGASVGGVRLRDLSCQDRLDEMRFELPLVGGDRTSGTLSVSDIARLLEETLPVGDPLGSYTARLADPALDSTLRGYLIGQPRPRVPPAG